MSGAGTAGTLVGRRGNRPDRRRNHLPRVGLGVVMAAGLAPWAPACVTSDEVTDAIDARVASEVLIANGDTGHGNRDAARAVNGVRGAGADAGSLDVFSLGYADGVDNEIVLGWGGRTVVNGPGSDFVVFENAFAIAGGAGVFVDPIVVFVSRDLERWVPMPHDYRAADETEPSADPADWQGFAGVTPVLYHAADHVVDPFDQAQAGGDDFDLDVLDGDDAGAAEIREHGFLYVRLVSASSLINPDTGLPFPHLPIADGPDIDGVMARELRD